MYNKLFFLISVDILQNKNISGHIIFILIMYDLDITNTTSYNHLFCFSINTIKISKFIILKF